MAFERKWSEHTQRVLTARVVDTDDSAGTVWDLAMAGAIIGIDPNQVPPLKTLQGWCADLRRERETAEVLQTVEGVVGTLEEAHGMGAAALLVEAKRLTAKRPRASPGEWANLHRAIRVAAEARRALEGPATKKGKGASPAPATPDEPEATGFLSSLDPDA